ncbi:C-type lectin domain family 10 member A-like [Diabrotica virgifera virgifera]|uniref:C-type lectin domain family 10 member A-like n=1 Tax=Diabrotica virgifera virgifera TaxID=50390 RepID=A0A6P7FI79_DIAVI|nr:C-type lectin domain family 10 member A-like [Diabrotica virgifera virgifera]
MRKQLLGVLLTILFSVEINAQSYVITNDTGIAQSIAPSIPVERNGNTLYYFGYTYTGSWLGAMEHCKSLNMDLASIESQEENDFLYNRMKPFLGGGVEYWFWTSGTTLSSGRWIWMRTGRPIGWANWGEGYVGLGRCLEVRYNYASGLKWHDTLQNEGRHALCEAKITRTVADLIPKFCNRWDYTK